MKNPLKFLGQLLRTSDESEINPDKAFALELKGDQSLNKKQNSKAQDFYLEALKFNPDRIELYDKLIALQESSQAQWQADDFTLHVTLTMRRQEILNPMFKRINARALPEFEEIKSILLEILRTHDTEKETELVEKIIEYGDLALYPLLDFIISLKEEPQEKKSDGFDTKN